VRVAEDSLLAQVALSDLLHLAQNHGGDLLRREGLLLSLNLDLDERLAILVDNLVGEVLDVLLDVLVGELAANQPPANIVSN
jgi:hypothetical protein